MAPRSGRRPVCRRCGRSFFFQAEDGIRDLIAGVQTCALPIFYRQFGYEYALELEDRRATPISLIPKAKEGESEPFTLREATDEDIPKIAALYNRRRASSIVDRKSVV